MPWNSSGSNPLLTALTRRCTFSCTSRGRAHALQVALQCSYPLTLTYYLLPTTHYLRPNTHYPLPTTYYLLLTTYYPLPTTHYPLHYLLLTPVCLLLPLSTTHYLLCTASFSLIPTTHYLRPTTYDLLLFTFYFLIPTTYSWYLNLLQYTHYLNRLQYTYYTYRLPTISRPHYRWQSKCCSAPLRSGVSCIANTRTYSSTNSKTQTK